MYLHIVYTYMYIHIHHTPGDGNAQVAMATAATRHSQGGRELGEYQGCFLVKCPLSSFDTLTKPGYPLGLGIY